MQEIERKIEEIRDRIVAIEEKQLGLEKETRLLRREMAVLIRLAKANQTGEASPSIDKPEVKPAQADGLHTQEPALPKPDLQAEMTEWTSQAKQGETGTEEPQTSKPLAAEGKPKIQMDFEKFVGENLINKIGIIIIVIGVAFGVKYAIDHEMISPAVRIVMAYVFGGGLVGTAFYLKKNYEKFSAVLLSGAMAILYFITYAAFDFYALIPQLASFAIMVVLTVFTVFASIMYNQQVIAHIGLVGAYAVPFLLSTGSGQFSVLFSYMGIVNLGILAVAVQRYWKSLYYSAFSFTWLVYFAWYNDGYVADKHLMMASAFATLFFFIFYASFLAYKLVKRKKYGTLDVVLLLTNAFLFFGAGYAVLSSVEAGNAYLGLFTLANAAVHFAVARLIYAQKLADRNLFYLVIGLVMVFVTAAVPIQLDGNYVSLIWSAQALVLFAIGRRQQVAIYELISYPLMLLAFVSTLHDWAVYVNELSVKPFLNISFASSMFAVLVFGGINYLSMKYQSPIKQGRVGRYKALGVIAPASLLILSYFAFFWEIESYFNVQYYASELKVEDATGFSYVVYNQGVRYFKIIWLLNYSFLYFSLLAFVVQQLVRKQAIALVSLVLNGLVVLTFLIGGLIAFGELRELYIQGSEYYDTSSLFLAVRYLSFGLLAFLLFVNYRYRNLAFVPQRSSVLVFDALLHIPALWVCSNEVVHWVAMASAEHSYKLEVSIFWGIYSLFLIVLGIWRKKKHLRIGAIALFGVTLVKLFLYDIAHLDAFAKTIVFVVLGLLLLIISFLYNKYKDKIAE